MGGTVSVLRQSTDRLAATVRQAQGGRDDVLRPLDTLPALAGLLPHGALRAGATYSVVGSTALTMALVAGPSAAGAWCGVVGMPGFAAPTAADLGIDLDRLVLVPDPGSRWLSVVGALIDSLAVVVVRPPTAVRDAEAARIAARLRQREAVLITCGAWPRHEANLAITESSWLGVGAGHGHLTARQATISVEGRGTAVRPRQARLWLPDAEGVVRVADEPATTDAPVWTREAVG
ncbi:MAG TPA: hypothetical protein VEX15_07260 [Nocardioidaceae bacterium]|nr:hypothetical protein [Nocardioidaceae bacterium]